MSFAEGSRRIGRKLGNIAIAGVKIAPIPLTLILVAVAFELSRVDPNPGYDSELELCNVPSIGRRTVQDKVERKAGDHILIAGVDVEVRSGGQILVDPRELNDKVRFDEENDLNINAGNRHTEVLSNPGANPLDTRLTVFCTGKELEEKKTPTPIPEPIYGPPDPEIELTPVD